ncbi:MAG TPA: 50S ribosomal protein L11 methyltransferase, partial [Bacteroidales bacterium]|nr:50S ribosomal protein L11 methyltransferase [Bacteroidales bacterium]
MEYFEIRIHPVSEEKQEILTSLLAEVNFESFVETEDELLAYIQAHNYVREKVKQLCNQFEVKFTEKQIPDQNWNAEWEKNFEPVLIAEKCYIRAPFHAPRDYPYEIIIEPKMSFGTAHHETTALMVEMMMQMDFMGKKVLDMGCGTGILAILAYKMGATEVEAIDNDPWAYNNAMENMKKNHVTAMTVKMGDVDAAGSGYDILLANINRNVLISHLPEYSKCIKKGEL